MSFTLFTIGKTRVRLSALFFVPTLLAFLTENGQVFLFTLLALCLHEAAHVAMTYACGMQIAEIRIHALGLSASLGAGTPTLGDELAIAATGPLFSLTAGVAASLVYHSGLMREENVLLFGSINTVLALFNLLPAPPLDGGTMLRALLVDVFSAKSARRALVFAGFATAALMAAGSVMLYLRKGSFIPAALAAAFLALSSAQELSAARGGQAGAALRRRAALGNARCIPVREVALRGDVPAQEALRFALNGRYTRFIVLGPDLRELGALNENDLYEGIAREGKGVALQSLLVASIDQRRAR